jgi:NAD(P)-dependent dehydrogenase (short-subunit alcohol dehydrogenase family)
MEIRSESTALITGAASGFGAAVARRLTAAGARVVLADIDEAGGRAVAEEVGGRFVRCDVRKPEDSVRAVAAAEQEYGRLDIAFLNAGVASKEGKLAEIPLEEYTRVVEINLGGVYFGAQAALPALRRAGGGAIVATASLAGLIPMGIDPLYTLTKHAVVGLTRSLAEQFKDEGITVNAICPGFADTKIIAEHVQDFRDAGFPLLTADEVAEVVFGIITADETGQAWPIQPGREPEPYRFRGVPGPRAAGHEGQAPPPGLV